MNASPAPTVSLTTTFGAGTQTRVLRSHSAAPAAPMVTQIRGVFVASERAAQASATASALPGGLGVGSPVRSHEAILATSSWLREMRGDVKRSSTGVSAGGQAVPEYFPKSVEFSVHQRACMGTAGEIESFASNGGGTGTSRGDREGNNRSLYLC